MLVDSHAHLNFKAYHGDLSEVIDRCRQADMKIINVGAAYATSQKAVDLALAEDILYSSVGLHPIHVYDEEFEVYKYQDLIDQSRGQVVAIGETGFDYWHMQESLDKGAQSVEEIKKKQEQVFRLHISLAQKNNLPLIIHGRNGKDESKAYQDIYRVLKDKGASKGVVHCFGGNLEEAKQFVDLGFHIGFTGIVTFDKTGVLEQIVKWVPEDKMLIETDAPYLAPEPHRGQRNEPAYVKHVAEKIASIKDKSAEEIIDISAKNAIELFKL